MKSQSIAYLLNGSEHIYWIWDLEGEVHSIWDLWISGIHECKDNGFFEFGRPTIFGSCPRQLRALGKCHLAKSPGGYRIAGPSLETSFPPWWGHESWLSRMGPAPMAWALAPTEYIQCRLHAASLLQLNMCNVICMWLHHSNNGHHFDFLQNLTKEKKKVGQNCGLGREDLLLYLGLLSPSINREN